MSDALIVGLVAAIPAVLAAVSSFINGFRVKEVKGLVDGLGDKRAAASEVTGYREGTKDTLAAVAAGKAAPIVGADSQPQP